MRREEIVLGVATAIPCLVMMVIAATPTILMADWLRMVLIIVAIIPFLSACFYCVKIEQVAGYYKCKKMWA